MVVGRPMSSQSDRYPIEESTRWGPFSQLSRSGVNTYNDHYFRRKKIGGFLKKNNIILWKKFLPLKAVIWVNLSSTFFRRKSFKNLNSAQWSRPAPTRKSCSRRPPSKTATASATRTPGPRTVRSSETAWGRASHLLSAQGSMLWSQFSQKPMLWSNFCII
jgi:hypothetical protein